MLRHKWQYFLRFHYKIGADDVAYRRRKKNTETQKNAVLLFGLIFREKNYRNVCNLRHAVWNIDVCVGIFYALFGVCFYEYIKKVGKRISNVEKKILPINLISFTVVYNGIMVFVDGDRVLSVHCPVFGKISRFVIRRLYEDEFARFFCMSYNLCVIWWSS